MKKNFNSEESKSNNKGITLIALIITIIVLLILAGVTINAITNNESVMEKAQEAGEKTNISAEKEEIQLAVVNSIANNSYDMKIDNEDLEKNLNGIIERKIEPKNGETIEGEWCVQGKTGEKYIIDQDGNVMTVYENAKSKIKLVSDDDLIKAIIHDNKNYVQIRGSMWGNEGFTLIRFGYIVMQRRSPNKTDSNLLKFENIGKDNVQGKWGEVEEGSTSCYVRGNYEDLGYGIDVCYWGEVEDKYGNVIELYSDVYYYNFEELKVKGIQYV